MIINPYELSVNTIFLTKILYLNRLFLYLISFCLFFIILFQNDSKYFHIFLFIQNFHLVFQVFSNVFSSYLCYGLGNGHRILHGAVTAFHNKKPRRDFHRSGVFTIFLLDCNPLYNRHSFYCNSRFIPCRPSPEYTQISS